MDSFSVNTGYQDYCDAAHKVQAAQKEPRGIFAKLAGESPEKYILNI
jgi:hypothetical protein